MLEDDSRGGEIGARVAAWDLGTAELICCVRVRQEDQPTIRPAHAAAGDPSLRVHVVDRAMDSGLKLGCAVFSPTAAQHFADHVTAPDFPALMTQLNTQVTSPSTYASAGRQSPDVYLDDTMMISSCTIRPEGGPPLGRFRLRRTDHYTWYISGHETEAC